MRALSADAALLQAPRERRLSGAVHSVFERAVNVENEAGELFTLACRDLDNAPDTLIVDAPRLDAWGIRCRDRVDAAASVLTIGERITIRMDGARPWQPALPPYPVDDTRLRANLPIVRRQIERLAFGAAADAPPGLATTMPALIARRTAMLRAALAAGDVAAALRHGTALIGLGPGLTPSGDDYLVGLFVVLHLPRSPRPELAGLGAAIAAQVDERTNAISAAALKAAARGRVRECIASLLQALVQDSAERVQATLAPVLAIGSTSGADIAAGLVDGLELMTVRSPPRAVRV